jgi:ketosteroid isomerase-like protein
MSQENVELVRRAIAMVNDRDIEGYLACCTANVELRTPLASIGGRYEGPDDIRRFFADIQDTSPDFHLHLERVEAIGQDQVLASLHTTATGRASGIPSTAATTNVYDLVEGKIRCVRIFFDRQEALAAVGLGE